MDLRIVKHDGYPDLDVIHLIVDAVLVKDDVGHIALIQLHVNISNSVSASGTALTYECMIGGIPLSNLPL